MRVYTGFPSRWPNTSVVASENGQYDERLRGTPFYGDDFCWGFRGPGSKALAAALLADALGERPTYHEMVAGTPLCVVLCPPFEEQVVIPLPEEHEWNLPRSVVDAWIARALAQRGISPELQQVYTYVERKRQDLLNGPFCTMPLNEGQIKAYKNVLQVIEALQYNKTPEGALLSPTP